MPDKKGKKRVLAFVSLGVAAIVLLVASFTPGVAGGAPAAARAVGGAGGGGRSEGSAARAVVLSSLPQVNPATTPFVKHYRPLDGLTDEQYAAKKLAAAKGGIPAESKYGTGVSPAKNLTPSLGFSQGFYAQQEICCTPSDHALAVSENFVVQFINTFIAVYDKNGNLQSGFPKDADTFFGLPSGTYTTDPRGFYDWQNHRFVFVMLTESSPNSGTNTGSLMVAVSQTHDPRLGWWIYNNLVSFPSGECPDFPTLGHDSNNWGTGATKGGFYIGINEFGGTGHCQGSGFIGNYAFFFPKDPFLSGAGYSYWYFTNLFVNGTNVDTIQPANITDRADRPDAIYLVNSYNMLFSDPSNGLAIWSVSGPTSGTVVAPNNPFAFLQGGSGPILTFTGIGTAHNYTFPPGADEPNATNTGVCSQCIDTGDKRISGSVKYHAGELFGSMETGVSGGTAGPLWFDVHPVISNNNSQITGAEERQEDCFVCGGWASNGSASYATLQPDSENNLQMVFEFSADNAYPGMVYTSRRVSYGDSLMDGVGNYLVGGAAYYAQGCNKNGQFCRWGDYTATAPDLIIANYPRMWFAGMYANNSGNWGTAIGATYYHFPSDN